MNDTYEIAQLGIEVDAWFRTRVGKYVLAKAQEEIEEASTALLEVDSEDTKEIKRLQRVAAQARLAIVWLNAAIIDGESAHHTLTEEEFDD